MQSLVAPARLSYSLTLHFNTNKIEAFKFTEEITFIHLILRHNKTHDLYDISFNNQYSKAILKYIIFEEVFTWQPCRVFDWCFDEELKLTLGDD